MSKKNRNIFGENQSRIRVLWNIVFGAFPSFLWAMLKEEVAHLKEWATSNSVFGALNAKIDAPK